MSLKIAISLVGAVCIPINTMLREEELEYILQQSDSTWLFFHELIKKTNHAESIVRLLDKEKLQDAHGNRQIQQAVCIPNDSTSSIDGKLMTWETFLAGSASIAEDAKEPYRNNVICKGGKVWQKLIRENEESTILIEKFP